MSGLDELKAKEANLSTQLDDVRAEIKKIDDYNEVNENNSKSVETKEGKVEDNDIPSNTDDNEEPDWEGKDDIYPPIHPQSTLKPPIFHVYPFPSPPLSPQHPSPQVTTSKRSPLTNPPATPPSSPAPTPRP